MTPKSCSLCGRPADSSAVVIVSTLRVSPRRQQSSTAIPFCNACLTTARTTNGITVGQCVSAALTTASDALTRQSDEQSHSPKAHSLALSTKRNGSESTSAVRPQASCRPCVTPCNSRQFDEVEKE